MSWNWASAALILSASISGAALAQDNAAPAGTPGVAVQSLQPMTTAQSDTGEAVTPNAPLQPVPGDGPPAATGEPTTPNAPVGTTPDDGPVPAGTEAGTPTAAAWMADPVVDAAVGATVVGVAVCLAVCGGSSSHTSSTTTTTPK